MGLHSLPRLHHRTDDLFTCHRKDRGFGHFTENISYSLVFINLLGDILTPVITARALKMVPKKDKKRK